MNSVAKPSPVNNDGFIRVKYKRRWKARNNGNSNAIAFNTSDVDSNVFIAKLIRLMSELQQSDCVKDFEPLLRKSLRKYKFSVKNKFTAPTEIVEDVILRLKEVAVLNNLDVVCYGLGNFVCNFQARRQLAFLLILVVSLSCKVYVYDPVFVPKEKEILKLLSLNVLKINENGKRPVDKLTIFFMPHCPHEMYNNLLWANWSAKKLSKLIIIGNSFSSILCNVPSSNLQCLYLSRAAEFVDEFPIPNSFSDFLCDSAIHVFDSEKLLLLPEETWANATEPSYSKLSVSEMIYGDIVKNLMKI